MNTVEHDRAAHRFSTLVDGHEAVLDYALAGNVMSITHTFVPEVIGGRGVAAALMRTAVSTARASSWTINPVCSYAADYLRRHPMDAGEAMDARKQHVDQLLDEALEESFPASDSPSVGGST